MQFDFPGTSLHQRYPIRCYSPGYTFHFRTVTPRITTSPVMSLTTVQILYYQYRAPRYRMTHTGATYSHHHAMPQSQSAGGYTEVFCTTSCFGILSQNPKPILTHSRFRNLQYVFYVLAWPIPWSWLGFCWVLRPASMGADTKGLLSVQFYTGHRAPWNVGRWDGCQWEYPWR